MKDETMTTLRDLERAAYFAQCAARDADYKDAALVAAADAARDAHIAALDADRKSRPTPDYATLAAKHEADTARFHQAYLKPAADQFNKRTTPDGRDISHGAYDRRR